MSSGLSTFINSLLGGFPNSAKKTVELLKENDFIFNLKAVPEWNAKG
jgi:hypothetical protein